ncbi:hypothetical protein BDV96DRAFT_141596 [Lophiotrema nucula]|uniref:Uncharacterized protein n=1 Tax=Lophiotrema nucula TaxID=690887 RepID=A0A6A5ZRJ8_9PLEO|nr:hypothetical protein BDV96DRAFT_141596 [Lophiotrema nucula]
MCWQYLFCIPHRISRGLQYMGSVGGSWASASRARSHPWGLVRRRRRGQPLLASLTRGCVRSQPLLAARRMVPDHHNHLISSARAVPNEEGFVRRDTHWRATRMGLSKCSMSAGRARAGSGESGKSTSYIERIPQIESQDSDCNAHLSSDLHTARKTRCCASLTLTVTAWHRKDGEQRIAGDMTLQALMKPGEAARLALMDLESLSGTNSRLGTSVDTG